MRNKTFGYMMLCSVIGVCLTAALILLSQYNMLSKQARLEVQNDAARLARNLALQENPVDYLTSMGYGTGENRVTYIDFAGDVRYDSYENPAAMDNHLNRPEIILASEAGRGAAGRYSETLSKETYFYAIRLDGIGYIRISKTVDSIYSMVLSYIPMMVASLFVGIVICFMVSRKLSKMIIEPINNINLMGNNEKIYDELAPFMRKIEEQGMQITMQMAEIESRSRTIDVIIQNMQEGFILLDKEENILSVNPGAIRLLNAQGGSYAGRNILELVRIPPVIQAVHDALAGVPQSIQFMSGERVIDGYFNPVFGQNGQITGIIILLLDITLKSNAENLRKEFSANVSHELKTPLTTILGYSEMIHAGMVKNTDVPAFAGKIKDEVQNLIIMIDDIMKLSRLDEGAGDRHYELFSMAPVMGQAVSAFDGAAKENGIVFEIHGGDFEIYANQSMMLEMLKNLIENAVKYNKPGGKVVVSANKEDDFIEIQISDTGIGIAEKHLDRIFERFYRADDSRNKKTGGTGLGLSIVKHIAAYHNGSVSIKSQLNCGTTVSVRVDANLMEKGL